MGIAVTACPQRGKHAPNKELFCRYLRQSEDSLRGHGCSNAKYQYVPAGPAPPPALPITAKGTALPTFPSERSCSPPASPPPPIHHQHLLLVLLKYVNSICSSPSAHHKY